MRRSRSATLLASLLLAGCLREAPPSAVPEAWLTITPDTEGRFEFPEVGAALAGVALIVPLGAVSTPTTLRVTLAYSDQPVFARAGMQLRTPAVQVDPINLELARALTLELPWYDLDVTIPTSQARAFRAPTTTGIPAGLWEELPAPTPLTGAIGVTLDRGGLYWGATFEANPLREPVETFGEICAEAAVPLDPCRGDDGCRGGGCLGERCAAERVATACRPAAQTLAHFGCACRCHVDRCQWVR